MLTLKDRDTVKNLHHRPRKPHPFESRNWSDWLIPRHWLGVTTCRARQPEQISNSWRQLITHKPSIFLHVLICKQLAEYSFILTPIISFTESCRLPAGWPRHLFLISLRSALRVKKGLIYSNPSKNHQLHQLSLQKSQLFSYDSLFLDQLTLGLTPIVNMRQPSHSRLWTMKCISMPNSPSTCRRIALQEVLRTTHPN